VVDSLFNHLQPSFEVVVLVMPQLSDETPVVFLNRYPICPLAGVKHHHGDKHCLQPRAEELYTQFNMTEPIQSLIPENDCGYLFHLVPR